MLSNFIEKEQILCTTVHGGLGIQHGFVSWAATWGYTAPPLSLVVVFVARGHTVAISATTNFCITMLSTHQPMEPQVIL